ncbi:MAG: hypothetical protein J7L04_12910 [Bacteroidales bacterium]|nr:hypothetical protein [Bacteroidales bacterium]
MSTMKDAKAKNNHKFLIRWIIFTGIVMFFGLFISFAIGFFISSFLESQLAPGLAHAIGYSFLGAGLGALIGLIQWILLRKRIDLSAKWILISAGGIALSELVAGIALWLIGSSRDVSVEYMGQGMLIYLLIYTIGGLVVGLLLRPELERFSLKSHLWVYACMLGWGFSFLVFLLGAQLNHPLKIFIVLFIGCLVFGAITGNFILKILNEKKLV